MTPRTRGLGSLLRLPAGAIALWLLAGCAPQMLRVDAGAAFIKVRGDVALQNSAGTLVLAQDRNDLQDDLGVSEQEVSPYLRAEAQWDRHRVVLSGFGYESSGSGVLANDYGDIPAGTSVASSMDFLAVTGSWSYDLVPSETWRLAPGVQLGYYLLDLSVSSQAPAFESVSSDVLVPRPYVEGEVAFGRFSLTASLGLIYADFGDADGRYWDAEAMVRARLFEGLELLGGFRYLTMDAFGQAGDRDFDVDLEVAGWFVGGSIVF
jgi:hypothetical protein